MPAPVFIIAFANNAAEQDRHLPALDAEYNRLNAILGDSARRWELVPSPKTSIRSFLDLLQVESYQNRIAMLHFAGHANGQSLLMESEEGAPEVANAAGIAEFLAQHEGLGFLFLNACSTVGQVQALLSAGVPAIIATEHDINDAVATEFSSRFYKEFVNGQTLRKAFDTASAAIKANATLKDAAQTRSISGVGIKRDPDDWPWKLHVREGNNSADQWSLGIALDDPLWGVPEPAERPLPDVPYRHLLQFGAEHAAIFFGRRRETRAVYDAIERGDARRVVLLHGVSGAGKSSLLEAGLLPRLLVTREVAYLRRSPERTLLENLQAALGVSDAIASGATGVQLAEAWKQRETGERALTVILDQVEEALGDSKRDGKKELTELVSALKQIFDGSAPPKGTIVLGFRKEWLAEVQSALDTSRLASTAIFLDRLGERGIEEAIEGVPRDARLRAHYALTIPDADAGLSPEIAGDLVTDLSSAIAPTLQVLLTKMWERADRSTGAPVFTRSLYRSLVQEGALLKDFVNQQLESIHGVIPASEESGLVLDVLAFHTTELGDATRFRSSAERASRYPEGLQPDVARVVELASAGRLMATAPETAAPADAVGTTRLAHDTLARYVRQLATHSEKPVQRALRVLEERAPDWEAGGTQRTLDAADLKLVESGLGAMRRLSVPEGAMIAASRAEVLRAQRGRRNVRIGFALAAALVAVAGGFAWVQGNKATQQAHRATVQALVSSATNATDPLEAALMLTSLANETEEPTGALQAALSVLERPIPYAVLTGHTGLITASTFSPDGKLILTASSDSTARIWQRDGSKPPIVLRGHTAWIVSAAFSPDQRHVLTAANDSTVRVWQTNGAGSPIVLRHNGPLSSAAYCPNGKWIVTAADSVVRVWRSDGVGAPVELFGHQNEVTKVLCSPNSSQVLSVSDDHTARVWRIDGIGKPYVFRGHRGVVISAAFNASGSRIVTGADDSRAQVWNSDGTGTSVELRNGSGAGTALAFSP
ncbi:MAG: CHAT domain-containing protein, partial [Gemmatimonadota bacterium]|nr:CHAT domain-containing protein [Gemmatimonadota bacterium]